MRIGLIGLGTMGLPVSARLAESGFSIAGYDIDPANAAKAPGFGVAVVPDIAGLAGGSDIVILSLPTPAVARLVVGEVVTSSAAGTIIVDLSTNDPRTARDLHSHASGKGVFYLDAPVSGGPSRARTGELTMMVGGDEAAVETARPVLTAIARQVEYVGASGAGTIAKLLNNFVAIWGMIGVSQASLAAERLGVSLDRLHDVMSKSSARSYAFDRNAPKIRSREYRPDFSVELGEKDIGLALDLIGDAGLAPFAESEIRQLFTRAVSQFAGRDLAVLYEALKPTGDAKAS